MSLWYRFALSIVVLGYATAANAQRCPGCGGGNYNPATEATLTATVEEVKNIPAPGKGPGGLHLVVSTESGPIEVHVGPAAFVTSKNVTFAKGDAIIVIGSKITMNSQDVVLAREIRKGAQVLTLRDANGFPLWSGRGRTQ